MDAFELDHLGSSPLARGTRVIGALVEELGGLIPARAGNTSLSPTRSRSVWAHPRSRGEHSTNGQAIPGVEGSSPLARGTHESPVKAWYSRRLIPARAGNTKGAKRNESCIRAHPRSRGEHQSEEYRDICAWGSSPLARGTRDDPPVVTICHGLIPARAGNTGAGTKRAWCTGAHPRSRGEHSSLHASTAVYAGSSPLARGTLDVPDIVERAYRLIPARAGNTASRWKG